MFRRLNNDERRLLIKLVGAALIIFVFSLPRIVETIQEQESHRDCISQHGDWAAVIKQCTFKENNQFSTVR